MPTMKSDELIDTESLSIREDGKVLKRKLNDRMTTMLALTSIIGPGCLIGTANALKNGPGSLLLSFGLIGIIALIMMQSLGEVTVMYPGQGSFSSISIKFVDKSWGLTIGWYYAIIWIAVLANEYNVISNIMVFWGPQVPIYGYVLIFWSASLAFQFLGVGWFGEVEFWIGLVKISGLVAFYIFSIVYVAGGINKPAFGFHYWNDPGAFNDGFKGVASTFVFASTFFAGVEAIATMASEVKNPGKALPRAIYQTIFRIFFIYIGLAISYGMTVPYDDPKLNNGTKTLQSPMTIAIANAGWAGGANLINAFILITCLSALNGSIYIGSRTLVNLAREGGLFKFFGYINSRGVPVYSVILMNCFGLLSLMNISTGASEAYNYIVNLSGISVFIVWASVSFVHLRFRRSWVLQGRSLEDIPFKGLFYPYFPILSIILNLFLALIQGWSYFKPFQAGNWVDAYILIPFFFVLFFFFKIVHKTKWVNLREVDLDEGRRKDIDYDSEELEPEKTSRKFYFFKRND
ncbi:general amino acid permease Agp3p [[Candida] jaroonii]|uniref:General amino acid permease Agp3p n=1 Tax=[Candida] jaroonii TaxID=467808 RepID=A0ACA9XZW7_9ASCO|nr:general amino acid permease Agp3p [[Candida] jaroonii]